MIHERLLTAACRTFGSFYAATSAATRPAGCDNRVPTQPGRVAAAHERTFAWATA
ncbi:hypothetical protein MYA_0643 [Burkholderia sp. KJ006]|nr:hypothetical protein MYA_0643 [Burkholderia sp. KJ006]